MGKKLSSLRKQVRSIERQVDALKQDVAKLRKLAAPQSQTKKSKKSGKKSKQAKAEKRGPGKQKKPVKVAGAKRKTTVASSPVVSISSQTEDPISANESARPTIG